VKGIGLLLSLCAVIAAAIYFQSEPIIVIAESSELSGSDVQDIISQMDSQYEDEKAGLAALVTDIEDSLQKGLLQNSEPPTAPTADDTQELNQKLKAIYESAGLDFEAEEQKIITAFDSASSDIESLPELQD